MKKEEKKEEPEGFGEDEAPPILVREGHTADSFEEVVIAEDQVIFFYLFL